MSLFDKIIKIISAFSTLAIAAFTVFLAITTKCYVDKTSAILKETRKQSEASLELLQEAKNQSEIAHDMLKEAQKQSVTGLEMLSETRKQSELTYRPYVGIFDYSIGMKKHGININLMLVNTGKSAAKNVKISLDWIPVYEEWKIFKGTEKGKSIKVDKNKPITLGKPFVIFPDQDIDSRFSIQYNHTLDYWIEKYKEISILVTIFYKGIKPSNYKKQYISKTKFTYWPDKKKWVIEWSEAY